MFPLHVPIAKVVGNPELQNTNGYRGWSNYIGKQYTHHFDSREGQLHQADSVFSHFVEPRRLHNVIEESDDASSIFLPQGLQECLHQDSSSGKKAYDLTSRNGSQMEDLSGSLSTEMLASIKDTGFVDQVSRKVHESNPDSRCSLISAHVNQGHNIHALGLYGKIWASGIQPDTEAFIAAIQACSAEAVLDCSLALKHGLHIHAHIIEVGLEASVFLGNSLITMYGKCRRIKEALILFEKLWVHDVVSWNALITGYLHNGEAQVALDLFVLMQQEGMEVSQVTFVAALKACATLNLLKMGEHVHVCIVEHGYAQDVSLSSALLNMYAECGMLETAYIIFCSLPMKDAITWNVLIEGYVQNGFCSEALDVFWEMQRQSLVPSTFTFVSIINACARMSALEEGRRIHKKAIECGMESHIYVANSLIDMYCKAGSLNDACSVFQAMQSRDAATWSAMILGYVQHGYRSIAMGLLERIKDDFCIDPDPMLYVAVIKACSGSWNLEHQRMIHSIVIGRGFESNVYVRVSIIDMYAKGGHLFDACIQFGRSPIHNVVTWSALIAGLTKHDCAHEALHVFKNMEESDVEPNEITFVSVLQACAATAALATGKRIHAWINKLGTELNLFIASSLIEMYSRCGGLKEALSVFRSLSKRNIVTWNALLTALTLYNDSASAFDAFEEMMIDGVMPNDVTYLCLLSACSHGGLLDKGVLYFRSMSLNHGLFPKSEHYNSMINLLGRVGKLSEAEELIEINPFTTDATGWTSLLNASKMHANVHTAERCFNKMVTNAKANAGTFLLMSNIYSNAHMWKDAKEVEQLRAFANSWKKPAKSYIEVDNYVHQFIVGDKSHPQWPEIYAKMESFDSQRVLLEPDNQKLNLLCWHSEKLAVAFGLISTPHGVTIRVTKNLRMCSECHEDIKLVSKTENREIFIADAFCLHHFHDGHCLCDVGNAWK